MNRRKPLVRQSAKCTFYGKVPGSFLSVSDRHLLSGVTLHIAFRWSKYDFVIMYDNAAKHYKVKFIVANLYMRKMTLSDHVVSAMEKNIETLITIPASSPCLETLKNFLRQRICTVDA